MPASQVALVVKDLPALQETQETRVQSLGLEDLLEEEMAIHSRHVFLPGKSHGQRNLACHSWHYLKKAHIT